MTHSVLIVDDDELIRALVRRVFERAGYAVRCAIDGADAVGAIETDRPDVIVSIVSDVRMPRLDRAHEWRPVGVVSAWHGLRAETLPAAGGPGERRADRDGRSCRRAGAARASAGVVTDVLTKNRS